MEEILLYEFPASNFCEKVQWSLDFKGLKWKSISVDPLTKIEVKKLNLDKALMPAIQDLNSGKCLSDSTKIMLYLDQEYPTPILFPIQKKKEIVQYCINLDSTLGLATRRLLYGRILLDCKDILFDLFVKPRNQWLTMVPFSPQIISSMLGIYVMERYNLHTNSREGMFQLAVKSLDDALDRLSNSQYLFGEFSAADITFFSHLRPLRVIPYFKNNPKYAPLFTKMNTILFEQKRPLSLHYEDLFADHKNKSSLLGRMIGIPFNMLSSLVTVMYNQVPSTPKLNLEFPKEAETADNDHQPLPMFMGLWNPKVWLSYLFLVQLENQFPKVESTQ